MGTKSNKEHTQKSNDYQIISSNQYDTTMNTEKISKLESEKEQSSVSNSITIENTNENININNSSKTIPYIFRWKGNAQKVYITGDFLDNWKNFAEMTKNPKTGEFEYIIYLSKTVHQFKFIVDGNWVFSQDYEIIKDNSNNINNILDITNSNIISDLNNTKTTKDDNNQTQHSTNSDKKKKMFGCVYPNSNELNLGAPPLPHHYSKLFDMDYQLDKNKNKISDQWLKFQLVNNDSENSSYKTIVVFPHEKLLHLCFNKNDCYDYKYMRTSATCRIQHKFLTIIYYRPKKGKK